jgi:hypothetical protein
MGHWPGRSGRGGRGLTRRERAATLDPMREDQIFGLVAMVALLLWLSARMLPEAHRQTFERLAFLLIGGGIVVALLLTVLHFMA